MNPKAEVGETGAFQVADIPRVGTMPDTTSVSLTIENRLSELQRVETWLGGIVDLWVIPAPAAFAIDLIINEAVVNIMSYGYRDEALHEISISLRETAQNYVVEIIDDGIPFNPLEAPEAMPATDLQHATVGGRGIRLIKSYASGHAYEYARGRNHLALSIAKDQTLGDAPT